MTFTGCHTPLHTHWRFLSYWSGHVKSKLLFYYKAADFALKVPHLHWNDRCFLKTSQEELQYKLYVTKCHSSEVGFLLFLRFIYGLIINIVENLISLSYSYYTPLIFLIASWCTLNVFPDRLHVFSYEYLCIRIRPHLGSLDHGY